MRKGMRFKFFSLGPDGEPGVTIHLDTSGKKFIPFFLSAEAAQLWASLAEHTARLAIKVMDQETIEFNEDDVIHRLFLNLDNENWAWWDEESPEKTGN